MSKQPVFDRDTWQRQKDLLAAEEKRLTDKEHAAGFGMVLLGIVGLILFVGGAVVFFGSFIFG